MGVKEGFSPTTMALVFLRNTITSLFIHADNSLLNLSEKYKLLETVRQLLLSSFFFFLRLLPFFFPSLNPKLDDFPLKPPKKEKLVPTCGGGDSGIARALSQLLLIVNDIPVSSRKYEVVRSLAERIIEENHRENATALREVNGAVLSTAFARTLSQLEAAVEELDRDRVEIGALRAGLVPCPLNRIIQTVRKLGDGAWNRLGQVKVEGNLSGSSAEKLSAELLWLAQKMAACGFGEEAVGRWASASHLAWLGLSAEPRLQGSLVKIAAFLFKQAQEIVQDKDGEEQLRQTRKKMLISWLPLLCRASNGTDAPVLSMGERVELERILEELIESLENEEQQEQVLSLWLHHFTDCSSSDWPNLHASYARWCTVSRQLLLCQGNVKL
ncbi:hypothetical protein HS088_TW08G00527 [Tripterygium wilfordii]|uniref:Uncharacterized protein n=1 Tax=Tripterygium wilfordii TaxID=458696 RepID=A0A7J7DCF1_TRIWF|nr:uncharacterized protein LOC120004046 [Tripterygium wilfordii]KAF5743939.1 hypothetical protein HS088_TW08G00527 [Tripterygium wilfordii]